ncbi:MAG: RNA-guided pseudouridylation complex pseudouridine synthase subunit Cbf5 [Candidatus Aenigmarchaeota archaeon]|nr:RNA-guided pseudouridylation complex pseudouridine synthase subunit Cbf5 [Candidatus Aenigmarchaeota archaeon]MDI6722540.1 RNA-guided pseudouridylation complex pseudouridine synthase subunit Cbf5 [Candidatus Aenigmarchaeota archaeon]
MEFVVKSHDVSNYSYGKYPGSRSVEELLHNGIIILDKWQGPTSRDVTSIVKKMFGLNKAGHCGTLDPHVSGILVICLENACKIMPALQHLEKEYVGIMRLHNDVNEKELRKIVSEFTGKIRQKPPVRSAVARKERVREVYDFNITEISGRNVLFRIKCEAGMYVRKLCHDIGLKIGGSHMSELRRVEAGSFDEGRAVRMHDIADAYMGWKEGGDESIRDFILPVEAGIEHLKKVIIKDSAVYAVASGSPLYTGGVSRAEMGIMKNDLTAVMTLKGELVSIGKAQMPSEDMMKSKGIAVKTDRVIIDKNLYKREK